MLEFLQQWDTRLFLFFNASLANQWFDVIMPFVTEKRHWYPVWTVAVILLLWKGGKRGRWIALIAVLAVASSDLVVNQLMKPFFRRVRPCNIVEGAHLLLGKKSSFSMPSSHAANFFAVGTVFSYFYRRYQVLFWFFASLVAYSRVAVGVHYPSDVLVGALVGAGLALMWIWIATKIIATGLPQ